jgi:hypothetical protein
MPSLEHGFQRAIMETITGFIVIAIVESVLITYKLGWLIILVNILSIILIITLIDKITFWSLSYLCGWLFGLVILSSLLSPWEVILYIIIGIFFIAIKIKNKFDRFF